MSAGMNTVANCKPNFRHAGLHYSLTGAITQLSPTVAELRGQRGSGDPMLERWGQGCISLTPIIRDLVLRDWSTFYYLKRTKMRDIDQTFSKILRGRYPKTCGGRVELGWNWGCGRRWHLAPPPARPPTPVHVYWPPIFSTHRRHCLSHNGWWQPVWQALSFRDCQNAGSAENQLPAYRLKWFRR